MSLSHSRFDLRWLAGLANIDFSQTIILDSHTLTPSRLRKHGPKQEVPVLKSRKSNFLTSFTLFFLLASAALCLDASFSALPMPLFTPHSLPLLLPLGRLACCGHFRSASAGTRTTLGACSGRFFSFCIHTLKFSLFAAHSWIRSYIFTQRTHTLLRRFPAFLILLITILLPQEQFSIRKNLNYTGRGAARNLLFSNIGTPGLVLLCSLCSG